MRGRWLALMVAGGLAMGGGVSAQEWSQVDDECGERSYGGNGDQYCLTFEARMDDPSALEIDGGQNGAITVIGWDRDFVSARAKVFARAQSEDRAQELAEAVRLSGERGRLSAEGERTGRRESWGVTWEVMVPYETDLDLETHNGGIEIADVTGHIRFEALNGGTSLVDLGGDVQGRTTNGGLKIDLNGTAWRGAGLDVQTTNGGVTMRVPEGYSAELETATVNGGIQLDFPVTVRGKIGRRLATTLGEGGPAIRATTTNGGVKILRGGSRPVR